MKNIAQIITIAVSTAILPLGSANSHEEHHPLPPVYRPVPPIVSCDLMPISQHAGHIRFQMESLEPYMTRTEFESRILVIVDGPLAEIEQWSQVSGDATFKILNDVMNFLKLYRVEAASPLFVRLRRMPVTRPIVQGLNFFEKCLREKVNLFTD